MKGIFITALLLVAASSIVESHPHSSRQLLPHRPGYVPVYIRNGDTPLEDINLDLAEAFHAISSGRSAARRNDIQARSQDDDKNNVIEPVEDEPSKPAEEPKLVEEDDAEVPKVEADDGFVVDEDAIKIKPESEPVEKSEIKDAPKE